MARKTTAEVLITGATGALGPRVVQAFLDAGQRVRTLSIDQLPVGSLPQGVDAREGDVADASTIASALDGIKTVIHLAALLHVTDPPAEVLQGYRQVNVGGTAILIEQAVRVGVERVVLFSTISVYGGGKGRILKEESVPRPETPYASSKLDAERIVLSGTRSDGRPLGTVLRLGAIYGSRVKGNYRRLVQALARGRFVPVGSGKNRRTLLYDKDAAQVAVLAARHPAAAGQVDNVSDGGFHTLDGIIAAICDALGRRPPRFAIPTGAALAAAGMLEAAARLVGLRSPLTRATVEKYIEDIAVDSSKIRADLGFVPGFSLAEGWRETIHEMRRMGDL